MKKIGKLLLTFCAIASVSACGGSSSSSLTPTFASDSLYVKKVENLDDSFIKCMDASAVPSLEASGVKYYNFDGKEEDVYKILADNGINYIRVRIWNDPFDENGKGYGGGNCDLQNAINIGKRAAQYGMKLFVDFHYSDFWADPAKQMVPKAWKGLAIEAKADALYQYTLDSLNALKDAGVDIGMVSLGNETNGKMCGETTWFNIVHHLMKAGSRAVREFSSDVLIAVHFTEPQKAGRYDDYAYKLAYYKLDYDVFASSWYPYWHGTLENLSSVLSKVASTYNKKVMVAETSYAHTYEDTDFYGNTSPSSTDVKPYAVSLQGQANNVREVIDTIKNKTTNGIGVAYWEGTWISVGGNSYEENFAKWEEFGSGWAASYAKTYDPNDAGKYYGGCPIDNQAFFDKDGKALESLKVWKLVDDGNEIENTPDQIEETTVVCDLNGEIVLPSKVNAIMKDNSRQAIDVEWHDVNIEAYKSGGVKDYEIYGTAQGMEAKLILKMVEYNFLTNYSFEEDANVEKNPKGYTVVDRSSATELHVMDAAANASTGTKSFHYWTEGKIDFDIYQEVESLPAGKYKFGASIMGGDAGTYDVHTYVLVNGVEVGTQPLTITSFGNWDKPTDSNKFVNFEIAAGDKVTVGIHVQCDGSGKGPWGNIDDLLLNSVK